MDKEKENLTELIGISEEEGGRLDKFLAEKFPQKSRSYFQKLIQQRMVTVDAHPVSSHHQLKKGQEIKVVWPLVSTPKKAMVGSLPFKVLHEEEGFLVIDKPAGLIAHPAGPMGDGNSLVDFLSPLLASDEWPEGVRPGLIHRLDRDTSGVLVFAKTPEAHSAISKQFADRRVKKTYKALIVGVMNADSGTFECKIGRHPVHRQKYAVIDSGRLALTKFEVVEKYGDAASLMALYPLTGRTHQLRVQLSHVHHPIIGDRVYGPKPPIFTGVPRQMLHAEKLEFFHPKTRKSLQFTAPLPEDFLTTIELIRCRPNNTVKPGKKTP